jgi:hypothetical protein
MSPDARTLMSHLDLTTPLIALYDAPDPTAFEPLVTPRSGKQACVFAFYEDWLAGRTVKLTADEPGCGGAAYWLFGKVGRSRAEFVKFLVDTEGLKASHDLMNQWLDHHHPYRPAHAALLIGPFREEQYPFVKTITFYVNPDQLSTLVLGANYHHAPGDPPAVVAPFGSGCMEILPLFANLEIPQAIIGATDLAMRSALPPDIMAFTVTKPMFERLCSLDKKSFLHKAFLKNLRHARGLA